jgi:hypothetical protein
MIPRTKFGDCSKCGAENTECIKKGKSLFCIKCRNIDKVNDSLDKTKRRTIARNLYKLQKSKGFDSERQNLIQDLDVAVSKYVRIREADKEGITKCFTCFRTGHWKTFDCGHFIPRGNMFLRWDLRNLKQQCEKCNRYDEGNLDIFAENLEEETPGIVDILTEESKMPHKWSRDELKEMLISIRSKLKLAELKFV